MTPYSSDYSLSVLYINDNQLDYSYNEGHSHLIYGVLPVVTLSSEIKITGGEGTASSPYQIDGDTSTTTEVGNLGNSGGGTAD